MNRLTKTYSNGAVTIDAEVFGTDQATLDGEIKSSKRQMTVFDYI